MLELVEDDGVYDAADAGAGGGDSICQGSFLLEVLGHEGDGRDEEAACADADAKALGEHDLVVFRGEAGHHVAEDDHEAAKGDEGVEVACVEEGACDDADGHEEMGFYGADPCDCGGGLVGENVLFVKSLENTECVDEAPRWKA